jgi:hypothetical protein
MTMRKGRLKLPDPSEMKLRKARKDKCPECRGLLEVSKGWGYCWACHRGVAVPVGMVVSKSQYGKFIYFADAIKAEIMQDLDEYEPKEVKKEYQKELRKRDYLVIEPAQEEKWTRRTSRKKDSGK